MRLRERLDRRRRRKVIKANAAYLERLFTKMEKLVPCPNQDCQVHRQLLLESAMIKIDAEQ